MGVWVWVWVWVWVRVWVGECVGVWCCRAVGSGFSKALQTVSLLRHTHTHMWTGCCCSY